MASAWGGSWASAWGNSWGSIAVRDTADGGYEWEWDEARKRLEKNEEVFARARRREQEAQKRLNDDLDRAYRRIVLGEPDIEPFEFGALLTLDVSPVDPVMEQFRELLLSAGPQMQARRARDEKDIAAILLALA